jgi:hypothetical protein
MATKAKHLAEARASKGKDYSPKWDNINELTTDQYSKHFRVSMQWYRLESSGKELKPKVINWMSTAGYSKEDIASFKKSKDTRCSLTMGSIAACLLRGMPDVREDFNQGRSTVAWLKDSIKDVLEQGKYDIDEDAVAEAAEADKINVYVPSIQERLRESAIGMTTEIEDAIEAFQADPETFDPKAFKILNLLKAKQAKAAHTRIIKNFYIRNLEELTEAANTKEEQLKEAYSHLSKVQLKKITAFYQEVVSACDMLGQEAKVNRKPRAKKPTDKSKVVAKLKYQKTNEPLKLVSINPEDIIGAQELWIYNSKSRKLGRYVADEYKELSVKGTTITGFNESKSVQKTVRKPEEKLKEFKAAGKVQLRKFLDEINATDARMNGRINEETILLKIA